MYSMQFDKTAKLAENGFHIRLDSLVGISNSKVGLDGLVLRPFRIRRATIDDHADLCEIEKACWSEELRCSNEGILNRLAKQADFESQLHLVAEMIDTKQTLGVLYTQRILNDNHIKLEPNNGFIKQEDYADKNGVILQLLAIAVSPEHRNLLIGKSLRDFALLYAYHHGIQEVIAMTRCSSIENLFTCKSKDNYVQYVMNKKDPTLMFHLQSGATIQAIMNHYRILDTTNFGHSIKVCYNIPCNNSIDTIEGKNATGSDSKTDSSSGGSSGSSSVKVSEETIRSTIHDILSVKSSCNQRALINLTVPFMSLGLDSLDMIDFCSRMETDLGISVPIYSLFEYSTPSALLKHLNCDTTSKSNTAIKSKRKNDDKNHSIFILGMSCRFPGNSHDPLSFYRNLLNGVDTVTIFPSNTATSVTSTLFASLLDKSAHNFDFELFGLSKNEAHTMDPHHRVNLQLAFEALFDAKLIHSEISSLSNKDIGVFVGQCNHDYLVDFHERKISYGAYSGMNTAASSAANIISRIFDLKGPSMVIDTACSSSLAALHAATVSLQNDECEYSLVIASDLILSEKSLKIREAAGMLSPSGKCSTFSIEADGYVRGEGGGAILLRRCNVKMAGNALAKISAVAINHDGKTASLTSPNVKSQELLLSQALHNAQLTSKQIHYLECHGTGTSLGDPIEYSAINRVYSGGDTLMLGAVKSNIGHLEGAAGMAGLIKAVCSLNKKFIPGNLHFSVLNPHIEAKDHLQVVQAAGTSLEHIRHQPLRAGLTSLGSGGTNVHAILENCSFDYDKEIVATVDTRNNNIEAKPSLAFLFSGQGSQYPNMGIHLFQNDQTFKKVLIRVSDSMNLQPPLLHVLYPSIFKTLEEDVAEDMIFHNPLYSMCSIFAVQLSLWNLWVSNNILPKAVVGHSIGEIAACVAAGCITEDEGVRIVLERGKSVNEMRNKAVGVMVAVRGDVTEVSQLISKHNDTGNDTVSIAAINAPSSIVLAGERTEIDSFITSSKLPHKYLKVATAYHSPLMNEAAEIFQNKLVDLNIKFQDPSDIIFVSSYTGDTLESWHEVDFNMYWSNQLRGTVHYQDAWSTVSKICTTFAEIGASPQLVKLGQQSAQTIKSLSNVRYIWLPSLKIEDNSCNSVYRAIDIVMNNSIMKSAEANSMPWRSIHSFNNGNSISSNNTDGIDQKSASEIEIQVFQIVESLLSSCSSTGLSQIDETSDLWKLGIDSLGLLELRSRISSSFTYVQYPSSDFFSCSLTIRDLVDLVKSCKSSLGDRGDSDILQSKSIAPASIIQQTMLYSNLLQPTSKIFHEQFTWKIIKDSPNASDLNIGTFLRAWKELIHKHDSLRMSFRPLEYDGPKVVVHDPFDPAFESSNWFRKHSSMEDFQSKLPHLDPASAPLFHVDLIHHDDGFNFIFSIYHGIIDGWSMSILLRDLSESYIRGKVMSSEGRRYNIVKVSPLTYMDYIDHEKQMISKTVDSTTVSASPSYTRMKDFWIKIFENHSLTFPTFYNIKLRVTTDDGEGVLCRLRKEIEAEVTSKIKQIAFSISVNESVIYNTVWSLTHHLMVNTTQFVYGMTASCRSIPINGIENLVGAVLNIVPVPITIEKGTSINRFLGVVKNLLSSIRIYEELPLTAIQNEISRSNRMFDVIFDYQPYDWNVSLSEQNDLLMTGCVLRDQVGTPLTFRVYNSKERCEIQACSECEDFNSHLLETVMEVYSTILQNISIIDMESTIDDLLDRIYISKDDNLGNTSSDKSLYHTASTGDMNSQVPPDAVTTNFNPLDFKETIVASVFSELLGIDTDQLDRDSDFFILGGDSLKTIRMVASLKARGLNISISKIFNAGTIGRISELALHDSSDSLSVTKKSSHLPNITLKKNANDTDQYQPYALSGLNTAHFVGLHTSMFTEGGISPQIYFEWEFNDACYPAGALKVDRFEEALNTFFDRHPMFASIVQADGSFQRLSLEKNFRIEHIYHFQGDQDKATESHANTRKEMMANNINPYEWPLFDIRVTHTSSNSSILHFAVSLFLMDAMSDLILREELSILYRGERLDDLIQMQPSITFRDYSLCLSQELKQSEYYMQSMRFWKSRIPTLPQGPMLPRYQDISNNFKEKELLSRKFKNYHIWLSKEEWQYLRMNCARKRFTVPGALLSCYAISLAVWTGNYHFLLNILLCLRHQIHPDVNKMVGNSSSTLLCEIDMRNLNYTLEDIVGNICKEVARNLEHTAVSGIEVMEEVNRSHGNTFDAVAPFIFTCPIGVEDGNDAVRERNWIFQEKFFSEKVPHTACVNAVKSDPRGSLCASLDFVDGTFPDDILEGVYGTYKYLMSLISTKDFLWNTPIWSEIKSFQPVAPVALDVKLKPSLLQDGFLQRTRLLAELSNNDDDMNKSAIEYIHDTGTSNISYFAMARMTHMVASDLKKFGVQKKQDGEVPVVGLVMRKGWEQVIGAMAILRADCAFLPIDLTLWPELRIKTVLKLANVQAIVTQSEANQMFMTSFQTESDLVDLASKVVFVDESMMEQSADNNTDMTFDKSICNDNDLAYLIYTSGSTGIPKGVRCHHKGALNTIAYLNEHFNVDSKDKVLCLSAISFDLSIYDIFGILNAGGTVVVPPPESMSPPDPELWYDYIQTRGITVWNSVPALMELLVSYMELEHLRMPSSLRLVYLSGDWFPLNLTPRIRQLCDFDYTKLQVISMGGATEAAIWSNIYELGPPGEELPLGWTSVPYGKPMRNQRMYILDDALDHCPPCVTGVIFIGGDGVADGYHRDNERTSKQFIRHPRTQEYLFRTGDLGRRRENDLLEILGREDSQVKVGGYRIELGEIERVINSHPDVPGCIVDVRNNTICAYIRGLQSQFSKEFISKLKALCEMKLPQYMIPRYFAFIERVPLTANGKLDRKCLPDPIAQSNSRKNVEDSTKRISVIEPADDVEAMVRVTFAEILTIEANTICCKTSSFFDCGGTSLLSLQLLFKLESHFGSVIKLRQLFDSPTVSGVSQILRSANSVMSDSPSTANGSINNDNDCDKKIQFWKMENSSSDSLVTMNYKKYPIVLINPAGASGLCYLEFSRVSMKSSDVYVLDDDVVATNSILKFETIVEAAECCYKVLLENLPKVWENTSRRTFFLGGWSYGGVLAVEIAKLFLNSTERNSVGGICLFDAPVYRPVVGESYSLGPEIQEIGGVAIDHFAACTALLKRYYDDCENNGIFPLEDVESVPVLHFVPATARDSTLLDDNGNDVDNLQEIDVDGTHWNILSGDNVKYVVNHWENFLKNFRESIGNSDAEK